MTPAVEKANEAIRSQFGDNVLVAADRDGGAYVIVEGVPIGAPFSQEESWIGFHIPSTSPYADVYPHFVLPGLSRRDGAPLGEGFSTGHNFPDQGALKSPGRRAQKIVPIPPGGTLHHYVPFHFAPRSPMLFTINNGNVPGCALSQDDIVHLTTTAQTIAQAGLPFVFTDYHAVMAIASFYDDLADLDAVDWDLFFEFPRVGGYCQYWQNRQTPRHAMRMETRQAEFLVRDFVPLATITQIGVRSENMAGRVQAALANTGWTPNIQIVPGWYY